MCALPWYTVSFLTITHASTNRTRSDNLFSKVSRVAFEVAVMIWGRREVEGVREGEVIGYG